MDNQTKLKSFCIALIALSIALYIFSFFMIGFFNLKNKRDISIKKLEVIELMIDSGWDSDRINSVIDFKTLNSNTEIDFETIKEDSETK